MKINNNNNTLQQFFKEIDGELWYIEYDRGNMILKYRVKEIISSVKSPFQTINIVDLYDFGRCLILDDAIQSTELDGYIYNEMISHIPVVTHENPKKVLIIGGGDCGVVNEILKYDHIISVDMVEIDRLVVEQSIKHLPLIAGNAGNDKRVNFIFDDGVKFVASRENCYDIIIIDSSDPIGPAVKLFSEEFYSDIKKCLKKDGIMVCQSQSPIFNQIDLKRLYSVQKNLFPIVRVYKAVVPTYPGGFWSFTLGSLESDPLDADVEKLVPNTSYINKDIFKSSFHLPNFMKNLLYSY